MRETGGNSRSWGAGRSEQAALVKPLEIDEGGDVSTQTDVYGERRHVAVEKRQAVPLPEEFDS